MSLRTEIGGMAADRLRLIDDHMERKYISTGRYTGTLTMIYRKGELSFCSTLGVRDRERQAPLTRDTIFRIYSMSKPITSVALMMLYEKGLFQLDDPVHEYIPEWQDLAVFVSGRPNSFVTEPVIRPMTIRDLLSHQSGLTYGFTNRTNVDAAYRTLGVGLHKQQTLKSMVESLAEIPLEFSPGTRWNYSVATDVVGYLVELISGQRFDTYLAEHIFQPLQMIDTGFYVTERGVSRFAANYGFVEGSTPRLLDDPMQSTYRNVPTFFSGGGGLVSTADDYLSFCKMLLQRGQSNGERLLSRKTVDLMTMNHLDGGKDLRSVAFGRWSETPFSGIGFGLGLSVMLNPSQSQIVGSVGEYSWGGAASTAFWIDPMEELIAIFMTQLMPSSSYNVRRELRTLVYSAIDD